MGWGRFDDAYPHHPKMLAAGADGLALDVAAVCYSNRYSTDGFIPAAMLPALYPPLKSPAKVAARLVEVGRWELAEGGWQIHDFSDYNPTAAEAEDKRRKRAEAGRKGGLKSGRSRSKDASKNEANASPPASPPDEAKTNPDPYPYTPPNGGGEPPLALAPEPTFAQRLAAEVREAGQDLPTHDTLHDAFRALLQAGLKARPQDAQPITMGLLAEYFERAVGDKIASDTRSMLARQVRSRDPIEVFDALAEAVLAGAGLGDYAHEPKAFGQYVTKILASRRGAA